MRQQAAQVYFPIGLYLQIKALAAEEGKPMAAWVRDLAEREVVKKSKTRLSLAEMPVYSFPGIETDISQRVDEIVYGRS
jgi:hypothetical protein